MFCGKCGNQLNQGEKFCGKCGNAVFQEQVKYSKVPKKSIASKKSLLFVLCTVTLAVFVLLGVIFIPDWNDDIPIDNDLPTEEQFDDDYISVDDEIQSSDFSEEDVLSEESTTSDEESYDAQAEENTTKKTTSKETTTKNNSTSSNKRPSLPNVIGMTQQQAITILNDFIKENNLRTDSPIGVIKSYRNDSKKGTVFDCYYSAPDGPNYYDNITINVSMGDGEKAWSTLSETINVPTGYTPTGYGSPYEVYSKSGCDDIEVEELGPYERKRVIYKDSTGNVVKTEAWSEWKESDVYYPYDEGEEYIGYDESTGYTKYYETQKNKVFYRWRYCETYH